MDRDLLWSSINFSRQSRYLFVSFSFISFFFDSYFAFFFGRNHFFFIFLSFSCLGTAKISLGTHEPFFFFYCFPPGYSLMFSRVLTSTYFSLSFSTWVLTYVFPGTNVYSFFYFLSPLRNTFQPFPLVIK